MSTDRQELLAFHPLAQALGVFPASPIKNIDTTASIFFNPSRLAMDIDSLRQFDVTATDTFGSPMALDCDNGGILAYDNEVINAQYFDAIGEERVDVTGTSPGSTLISLDCDGYYSNPVVVEVKPCGETVRS